jgi:uncharacterized RDD family membrane protein YckC
VIGDVAIWPFVFGNFFMVGPEELAQQIEDGENPFDFGKGMIIGISLAYALIFNKDLYLGRSPAKLVLKLQVLNSWNDKPASAFQCLIRNLTFPLWPIEAILMFANPARRLGDYIAGTRVASYDPLESPQQKQNWLLAIVVYALSASLIYLGLSAFYEWLSGFMIEHGFPQPI